MRARSYDPSTGRFLSQDTAALNMQNPLELNRYSYTANNPVNYTDPSGHQILAEYGTLSNTQAKNTKTLAGAVGGFTGSIFFFFSAWSGLCGPSEWPIDPVAVAYTVAKATTIGAAIGFQADTLIAAGASAITTVFGGLLLAGGITQILQIPDAEARLCAAESFAFGVATSAAVEAISQLPDTNPNINAISDTTVSDQYKFEYETTANILKDTGKDIGNINPLNSELEVVLRQLSEEVPKYPDFESAVKIGVEEYGKQGNGNTLTAPDSPTELEMAKIFKWANAPTNRDPVNLNALNAIDRLSDPIQSDEIAADIQKYSITDETLKGWAKLYLYQMFRNPKNPVAPGRALLMIRSLQKFFPYEVNH